MSVKMIKDDLKRGGSRRGFTLVELSLSLVFISILSLTIVLMINNAVESYQRGVTLNQINTVGMDLVDDIRTAVQNSSPENEAGNILPARKGEVNGIDGEVPLFGVFCTGTYTYVWNSGYFYPNSRAKGDIEKLSIDGTEVKLAKIEDENATVCSKMKENWTTFKGGSIDWLREDGEGNVKEFVELLGDKDNNLALYDLAVTGPARGSGTAFYSISFILGTTSGGVNINATNDFCSAPQEGSDFNYCAINKFNFAAQATGGKSE